MAKLAALFVSLLLLVAWGWFSWNEYQRFGATMPADSIVGREDPTAYGFFETLVGLADNSGIGDEDMSKLYGMRLSFAITFGAAVSLVVLSFAGVGVLFSVALASFVAGVTGVVHLLIAFVPSVAVVVSASGMDPDFSFGQQEYIALLFAGVVTVASFVVLRRMKGLLRGERTAMVASLKALLVLLLVCAPLTAVVQAWTFGYRLFAIPSALTLLTMALIGLTHSNYRYD